MTVPLDRNKESSRPSHLQYNRCSVLTLWTTPPPRLLMLGQRSETSEHAQFVLKYRSRYCSHKAVIKASYMAIPGGYNQFSPMAPEGTFSYTVICRLTLYKKKIKNQRF